MVDKFFQPQQAWDGVQRPKLDKFKKEQMIQEGTPFEVTRVNLVQHPTYGPSFAVDIKLEDNSEFVAWFSKGSGVESRDTGLMALSEALAKGDVDSVLLRMVRPEGTNAVLLEEIDV